MRFCPKCVSKHYFQLFPDFSDDNLRVSYKNREKGKKGNEKKKKNLTARNGLTDLNLWLHNVLLLNCGVAFTACECVCGPRFCCCLPWPRPQSVRLMNHELSEIQRWEAFFRARGEGKGTPADTKKVLFWEIPMLRTILWLRIVQTWAFKNIYFHAKAFILFIYLFSREERSSSFFFGTAKGLVLRWGVLVFFSERDDPLFGVGKTIAHESKQTALHAVRVGKQETKTQNRVDAVKRLSDEWLKRVDHPPYLRVGDSKGNLVCSPSAWGFLACTPLWASHTQAEIGRRERTDSARFFCRQNFGWCRMLWVSTMMLMWWERK